MGRPLSSASIWPTNQGEPMLPRPTITPSAPVCSRQRLAAAGLLTSPLAITGIVSAAFTAAIAAQSA